MLFIIFSCTKSDSNEKVLSDVDNSTKPEIFGEWSPAFSNQINNFIQKRSGNKETEETRDITIQTIYLNTNIYYIGSSKRRKILNQKISNYSVKCFVEEW